MNNVYKYTVNKNQIETIESYNNASKEFMEKIGVLNNYNITYDYLLERLKENDYILDLACGPGQISKYLKNRIKINITGVDLSTEMLKIAQSIIPNGLFIKDSIITFKSKILYNLIVIGFGIPYLNKGQTVKCIKNSASLLKSYGYFYISFMEGNKRGFEKTSFGGKNKFYIYYHNKEEIKNVLDKYGIETIKEYVIDYKENDGRITKDIVIIGRKIE